MPITNPPKPKPDIVLPAPPKPKPQPITTYKETRVSNKKVKF